MSLRLSLKLDRRDKHNQTQKRGEERTPVPSGNLQVDHPRAWGGRGSAVSRSALGVPLVCRANQDTLTGDRVWGS